MKRILITPRSLSKSPPPELEPLRKAGFELVFGPPGQQPTEEQLIELLPGCVGMLAGVEPISAKALDAADSLKAISRNGVGIDNVDLKAAEAKGIAVLPALGANARGVAELAIGAMFALARALPVTDAALKRQQWTRAKGIELAGRTLGLVGYGRIGQEVAGMAAGVGMKVVAFDPVTKVSAPAESRSLDQVLAESDVVSLHCPSQGGKPLIDAAALAKMRKGAILINTARADLLDDAAVVAALDSGKLHGVAVDVFKPEPPDDWTLARHPKTLATPHIGGFTDESVARATSVAVDNLLAFFK